MKTFTLSKVIGRAVVALDAADEDGVIRIKRRDGRAYSLRPEPATRSRTVSKPGRAK